MPSRTAHKKSRNGCEQCKRRRIKCDEGGPSCANCVVREIRCTYSHRVLLNRQPSQAQNGELPTLAPEVASNLTRREEVTQPLNLSVDEENTRSLKHLRELNLIHHYCTRTYLTFCHQRELALKAEERELWRTFVVKEALKHDFLLSACLAITSLHISLIVETKISNIHIKDAVEYYDHSCTTFRNALLKADDSNCHAIYACSLAYLVLGIAIPQFVPDGEDFRSPKQHILTVVKLYKGSYNILKLFEGTLLEGPWGVFLAAKEPSSFRPCDARYQAIFQRLRTINIRHSGDTCSMRRSDNVSVIDTLEFAQSRLESGVDHALIGWLNTLPDGFAKRLEDNDVVANLILMHWAVLLSRPNDLWFSVKSGKNLVDEISSAMYGLDPEDRELVKWCREQVELENFPAIDDSSYG